MSLFKTIKADGRPLNIPAPCVVSIESSRPGKIEDKPEARAVLCYDLGDGLKSAALMNDAEELANRLRAAFPPVAGWIRLSLWEPGRRAEAHDWVSFAGERLLAYEGVDPELEGNDGAESVGQVRLASGVGGDGRPIPPTKLAFYESAEAIDELLEAAAGGQAVQPVAPLVPAENRKRRRAGKPPAV